MTARSSQHPLEAFANLTMYTSLPPDLFLSCLSPTDSATAVRFEKAVLAAIGARAFLATRGLDIEEYARLGHCELGLLDVPRPIAVSHWGGEDNDRLFTTYEQVHWQITWREHRLQLLQATWQTGCGNESRLWVIGDSPQIVEDFILDVERKTNDPGDSILVFHGGYWQRSRELYRATQLASFDELVLSGTLKETIRTDFQQFLNARLRYESLGVAWRRGALFIGPPGNGKTHCVRALVKELHIPSLYVQSLSHRHYTSEDLLRSVFERARQLRPCVLIFEDLDALVNEENRSFFLNQLDGFEKNVGMLVLATTNHPERIDPAIVDRPSRFDRKYHFDLPTIVERRTYLTFWQHRLADETSWTAQHVDELVDRTEGFSFAYLKELVVSSLLRWMHDSQHVFSQVLDFQAAELLSQMTTTLHIGPHLLSAVTTDVSGD